MLPVKNVLIREKYGKLILTWLAMQIYHDVYPFFDLFNRSFLCL